MAPPDERIARYQMGPRSTRGLVAGWRTGQIACVAVGLVLAVGMLRSVGGVEGAGLGLLIVGGAVAAAVWPIRGRSVEQWVPTAAAFAVRAVAEGRYRPWRSEKASNRSLITRLSIFQLSDTGIGVIGDAGAGTWSGVVPVGGAGFALLDDGERANRIAAWSGVLAAMAREGSGLYRIQWVARSYPAYLDAALPVDGSPSGQGPGSSGSGSRSDSHRESYSQLVAEIAPDLWTHEVFLAVTVRVGPKWFPANAGRPGRTSHAPATPPGRQAGPESSRDEDLPDWPDLPAAPVPGPLAGQGRHFRRHPEPSGSDNGSVHPPVAVSRLQPPPIGRREQAPPAGRVQVPSPPGRASRRRGRDPAPLLRNQLSSLVERLEGAGLRCGPPLSPAQLAANLRRSFEVNAPRDVVSWPWPVGIAESWTRLRTDGTWQAVYWIAEWPRSEVGTTFMLPVLLSAGIRRTISVTMAPLPPLAAVRRAERERTSGSADAELRQRHGFAVSARARREQESRLRREAELADGHVGYRYSGYVTVTGHDVDDLERACARIEQDAALAQLELRRLYGAQEEAFCCSLPIGRGCR